MASGKSIVVVNTSPIIYLSAINHIHILKDLFQEVFIPDAVKREIISGGKKSFGYAEVQHEKWIKTRKIKNTLAKEYLLTDLDEGETEVIILAEELKSHLLVMDDRLGRRIAHLKGLQVIGTLRLLVVAKNKGLIEKVEPLLDQLKDAGFWISENVYKAILKQTKD